MKQQVTYTLMASLISGTAFAAPGYSNRKNECFETTIYGSVQRWCCSGPH